MVKQLHTEKTKQESTKDPEDVARIGLSGVKIKVSLRENSVENLKCFKIK